MGAFYNSRALESCFKEKGKRKSVASKVLLPRLPEAEARLPPLRGLPLRQGGGGAAVGKEETAAPDS